MSEWRKTLQNWPKAEKVFLSERPQSAHLSLHPSLRKEDRMVFLLPYLALMALLAVFLVVLCFTKLRDFAQIPILVAGFVVLCLLFIDQRNKRVRRELTLKRDKEELEARGELMLSGQYVGVAYCDNFSIYAADATWDRGILTIEQNTLGFRGIQTNFDLTANQLLDTKVKVADGQPRIFISWKGDSNTAEALSLEIRDFHTKSEMVNDTMNLANRLEEWRSQKNTLGIVEEQLNPPIRSSEVVLKKAEFPKVCAPAAFIAGAVSFVGSFLISLPFLVLLSLTLGDVIVQFGSAATLLLGVFLYYHLAPRVERRLRRTSSI